jgi:hypothetical protein
MSNPLQCRPNNPKARRQKQVRTSEDPNQSSRRAFLGRLSGIAAIGIAAGTVELGPLAQALEANEIIRDEMPRIQDAFLIRQHAAVSDRRTSMPPQVTNGDEEVYPDRIGNYTKGLPHNALGLVQASAYDAMLNAVQRGQAEAFDPIPMGGNVPMVNPQGGLTFSLEGLDSHQFKLSPAPAFASAERAGEAVECYWMALLRDANFSDYEIDPIAFAACTEITRLSDFRGPKAGGNITPATLFRGFTAGDTIGPYISQFLLQPVNYGTLLLSHAINTYLPLAAGGTDYITDVVTWLAVQNGQGPFVKNRIDPTPRHIRNGRDLGAYVHVDPPYQAFLNASLWFNDHKVPVNAGNPYKTSRNQSGFATFGFPHVQGMLGLASICALRAVWYQKWFVHRTVRPEEFGGRVHFALSGTANYPIHLDVLNSKAVAQVYGNCGSHFLPQSYPEGCPQHPSYAQGHGAIAGACATLLKAFFDGKQSIRQFSDVFVASSDGLSLVSYTGRDSDLMTVDGELDKLASNIGVGRNHAGVHWRSDYVQGLLLGEAVMVSLLQDERACFSEDFQGLTFRKFDGTEMTI